MSGKQETGMLRFLERTIISLDIFSITSLVFTFDIFVNVLFCEVFHGIDNPVFVVSLIGTTLNSILFFLLILLITIKTNVIMKEETESHKIVNESKG